MSLTIDDISTAAFLSRAAYNDKVIGTATTASANIAAQGANLAGWQYVSPTALEFGISASLVDQFGYFSLGTGASQQALLAYNPGTHTLAIAFRGTAGLTDLIIDLYGGLAGFGLVYQPFETFLVSKVLSGATSFGANRILVTGHSLGGAMAELMMSRHADTGALSFSAVTFGSPGTSDIIGNSSGSDARLLNIGHVDLETAVGTSLVTAYLQGDPVYRASVNEHILGSDIRVNQPYERDGYLDQHDSEQYQKTASAISRELTQNLQDSHPFNVREFSYVRATTPTDNYLSGNDNKNVVIGNSGHQSLIGRGGADILDGLEGNDTIFGDGGNDTLYGGSGSDLLYGGENDDVLHTSDTDDLLDGEEGNDRYVVKYTGGASTSTQIRDISGIDVLEILASTADPSKTRFLVAGNDLVVEVHGTSNQLLTTVAIRNNSNTAAVETLRLTYTGGFVASYDLQASLESAQAGISLSPPPTLADDFDGSAATTAVFSVGGSINGKLENSNDRDAFQVNLIAGRTYLFDLKGAATGSGTLVDPYMTLRDAAFTVLAEDDNTGIGANAQITHTATRTGLYFIRVGSANLATGTGTYNVFATQTSLTPVNSNSAPVVVGAGQAFSAGTVVAASTLFRGIDSDGDAIVSYIINDAPGSGYFQLGGVRQPEGSSFTVNATQYNNLQFVVGAGGTSDIFLVQASDGRAYGADNSVTIVGLSNVTPPPAVLTAQNDTATVVAGSQIVLNVLNNDNRALVRITDLQSAPNYITIRPGSEDAIIITPPNWFTGSFTFGYTATDGKGASASATVALTVAAPIPTNHAPEVQNVTRTLENNQQPQFDLLYNTYDADGETAQLTLQGYSSPSHGILARSGSVVTYTPSIGYVGSDGFSFVIQDPHGAQTSATVSLTVVQPAKAVDDVISTAVNTPIEFNVLQNDQYSNSNLFYLYGPPTTPGPQHGTVTFAQDGKFTYTPTPGYVGVDSFVYRIYYLTGYSTLSSGYVTLSVGDSGQQGTAGPDILNGSSANDAILGGGGDDTLWGGAGNDILDGGTGFDIVRETLHNPPKVMQEV